MEIATGVRAVREAIEGSRDLMAQLGAPVTARADWLTCALRCLPAGRPWAVVVRSPTGTRTGSAFLRTTRERGYASVALIGEEVSDHARLLAADQAAADSIAEGIVSGLKRIRGPWRLLVEQVPEGDPVLERLAGHLRYAVVTEGGACPVARLDTDRSLARYLSKNGRATAKQGRNRLTREDPGWRIERTRDPSAIVALLPTVVALHRRRDHAQGRRSDLDDRRRVDFLVTVTRVLALQGQVEVATLRVRDAVAAYFLVLLDGDVWRLWDGRIDLAHTHLRVGRVLDSALLTAALEDPSVSAVDWMRGDLEHKRSAANDVVRTAKLTAWSSPVLRMTEAAAWRSRTALRAAVPEDLRRRIRGRSRGVELPVPG